MTGSSTARSSPIRVRKRWTITHDVEGWFGVRAHTVNKELGVDPDALPSSDGIEIWRNDR